jgi:Uncharacterized protein conserved in bacteria (DUF2184)
MRKATEPTVLNSQGKPVVLNAAEKANSIYWQGEIVKRFGNSLGYEVSITTLTTIAKRISEQKFFEVSPADYLPMVVGQGAWSSNLTTYRDFQISNNFEDGIVNLAGQNSRLASADAAVDAVNILIYNWAKETQWTIMELAMASKSGNWDIVSSKERSRKKNYDLGIQRIAFLGARGLNGASGTCLGLLNQPGITTNTSFITAPISGLSPDNLKTFCAGLVEKYRSNCNRTSWPTHFVIPESDYNGLAAQSSPSFPIKSTLQVIEETLQIVTRNKNFKILPLAYADNAYNTAEINKQCYVLLNYDEESLNMQIPVPYTNTLANSINNFQFQAAAYSQFSGVQAIRPLELLYFQY